MTTKELLEKTSKRLRLIADDTQRITSGNISHNLTCLRGFALRAAESIERHLQEPVSEDEKIRKKVIDVLKLNVRGAESQMQASRGVDRTFEVYACNKVIAWLEKQGEQKPNYCHHEVDLSECSEEYRKAYYDGWNNCNMQHSQCKSELDDVVKCLINGMKFYYEDNEEATWGTDKWSMPVKYIIEVLEKQGEQKPADEVEPKFHAGEWVIDKQGIVHQIANVIENVTNHTYAYDIVGGGYFNDNTEGVRLWTIQDAKDGDVLYLQKDGKEHIIIYKGVLKERFMTFVSAYCAYNGIVDAFCFADVSRYVDIAYRGIMPATKEQCDQLEKAMADAGYTFDFEKRELKKIERKPTEWIQELESKLSNATPEQLTEWKEKYFKVEPAWSDEDETMYYGVVETEQYMLDVVYGRKKFAIGNESIKEECQKELDWLKSFKYRIIPQPQQEWSEQDKSILQSIILEGGVTCGHGRTKLNKIQIDWLTSLRPQNRWKPSDEQMKALDSVLDYLANNLSNLELINDLNFLNLQSLYKELKKLTE